jgi:hypothetical protein
MSVPLIRHAEAVDPSPQDSEYLAWRHWKIGVGQEGVKALSFFLAGMFVPKIKIKERSGPEGHGAPEQPSPRTAQNETTSEPKSRKYNFPATWWHRCARRSFLRPRSLTPCANFCTQGELVNASSARKSMI